MLCFHLWIRFAINFDCSLEHICLRKTEIIKFLYVHVCDYECCFDFLIQCPFALLIVRPLCEFYWSIGSCVEEFFTEARFLHGARHALKCVQKLVQKHVQKFVQNSAAMRSVDEGLKNVTATFREVFVMVLLS